MELSEIALITPITTRTYLKKKTNKQNKTKAFQ